MNLGTYCVSNGHVPAAAAGRKVLFDGVVHRQRACYIRSPREARDLKHFIMHFHLLAVCDRFRKVHGTESDNNWKSDGPGTDHDLQRNQKLGQKITFGRFMILLWQLPVPRYAISISLCSPYVPYSVGFLVSGRLHRILVLFFFFSPVVSQLCDENGNGPN